MKDKTLHSFNGRTGRHTAKEGHVWEEFNGAFLQGRYWNNEGVKTPITPEGWRLYCQSLRPYYGISKIEFEERLRAGEYNA